MKIQNVQSPNFGMLIKTPEGRAAIRRCKNVQTLEKLVQAEKAMKGTEDFDIVLGKDLKCKITSLKEAFFGVFESSKYSNVRNGVNEDILELGEYNISRHPLYNNDYEYGYSVWKTKELDNIEDAGQIDILVNIAKELDQQAKNHKKRTLFDNIDAKMVNKLQLQLLKS
jgi:hypothetical protein